jgi:GGDEF domain-containing protein
VPTAEAIAPSAGRSRRESQFRSIVRFSRNWSRRCRWDRTIRSLRWKSVIGPAVFALLAIALLVYDHLNQRVSDLVFWLTLGLIVAVFGRMINTVRSQSDVLEEHSRKTLSDRVTGLQNGRKLRADIEAVLAAPDHRYVLVLFELDGLQAYNDRNGYQAGDELLRRFAADLINAVQPLGGAAYRSDGGRLAVLAPAGERHLGEIVLAATASLREDKDGELIARTYGETSIPEEADEADLAFRIAGQRLAAHKQRQHRSARRQAHAVLMAALSARRPDLRDGLRVGAYRAIALARRVGLDRDAIDDVALATELQDIGLLAIPESVLEKEAALDEIERAMIRSHSVEGERIVGAAPGLAPVAQLIRSSAEHFDGSGYPDGLVGEAIPIGARIIAVSVAFAAMTSPRPYRQALTVQEALRELRRCAGTQFDPRVVEGLAEDLAEETAAIPA